MKNKYKQIEQEIKNEIKSHYDENGCEIVKLSVAIDDNFISPYSIKDKETITHEVAEFLETSIKETDKYSELRLEIYSNEIDENEQKIYPRAIKEYYKKQIADTNRRLRENTIFAIAMLFIGVFILSTYMILELSLPGKVFIEVLDIAAWVFIWESVAVFFIHRTELKYEKNIYCRLYLAKVIFKEDK